MNRDQIKGRITQAKGKAKEVAGRATGDERLEAKERVKDAFDRRH